MKERERRYIDGDNLVIIAVQQLVTNPRSTTLMDDTDKAYTPV